MMTVGDPLRYKDISGLKWRDRKRQPLCTVRKRDEVIMLISDKIEFCKTQGNYILIKVNSLRCNNYI